MSIENRRQLENTRRKLQGLEQLYTKKLHGLTESAHIRELTLRSLKKRINQFKEEITRFEARARSSARATSRVSDGENRSDHPGGLRFGG
jgi:hypothetical protein